MKRLLIKAINRLTFPRSCVETTSQSRGCCPLGAVAQQFQQGIPADPSPLPAGFSAQAAAAGGFCSVPGVWQREFWWRDPLPDPAFCHLPGAPGMLCLLSCGPVPSSSRGWSPSLQSENPTFWEIFPSQVPSPALKRTETYESLGSSR